MSFAHTKTGAVGILGLQAGGGCQCAKPQKVEFVVRKTDGRTETSSKSGYRLEYKLFAVIDRTGAPHHPH